MPLTSVGVTANMVRSTWSQHYMLLTRVSYCYCYCITRFPFLSYIILVPILCFGVLPLYTCIYADVSWIVGNDGQRDTFRTVLAAVSSVETKGSKRSKQNERFKSEDVTGGLEQASRTKKADIMEVWMVSVGFLYQWMGAIGAGKKTVEMWRMIFEIFWSSSVKWLWRRGMCKEDFHSDGIRSLLSFLHTTLCLDITWYMCSGALRK